MAGFYNCLKTNKPCITMTTSEEQPETLDGEGAADASSGKKKSKFQTFKNFFAKKKKSKDLPSCPEETKRKPSHDNSDGGSPPLDAILLHSPGDIQLNGSTGNQALLQDHEFPSEALCDVVGDASLQENLPGKVKNFEQNFCLESPLVTSSSERMDDLNAVSEDDGLPSSLLDISTIHEVRTSSITQVASGSPSKDRSSFPLGDPISPLEHGIPVDFNTPASPLACLDTSAARHRIAMNPRKQKGFAKKTLQSLVEQLLEKQKPLEPDGDKRSPSKILEEAAGQRKAWEGLLSHDVVNVNEDGTDVASPGIRIKEVLRSSGLWKDGTSVLISDAKNLPETPLQLSSTKPSPDVASSLIKDGEEENMDNEGEKKGSCDQKAQSGPDVTENSECFHLKTKATGLHSASPSTLPKSKVGKELGAEDNQVAHSQRTEARANVSKPARKRHRVCDKAICGDSSPAMEADPVLGVPQLSSSSDAPKDSTYKNMHAVNEDGRRPSDMELQPSPGPGKPRDSLQGTLSTLEVEPDRPGLLNAAGKKPCLLPVDSTIQELGRLSSGRPPTVGSTEVASKTRPPGVQLGNVITQEESKATEVIKTQTKPPSVKPVRFTIAPAWQRSLSGGSSSVDNSCPQNFPTSPVKPELFEGTSPLDAGSQILNMPERSDRANRNTGVPLNSSGEEVQNCESPFGVKLRRTSSLLKYQSEHHWDPPKLVPLAVPSPSSVKTETKAANSGTNLQNLTTGVKGLVANSGIQEKNLQKTKGREEVTKLQKTKAAEEGTKLQKTKAAEEVTKLQKTKAAEEVTKLQKTKAAEGGPKPQASKPSEGRDRILPQESSRMVEKDTRLPPILPVASCSSTEPPWLSLAKKKAKAWSEMPQAVQ